MTELTQQLQDYYNVRNLASIARESNVMKDILSFRKELKIYYDKYKVKFNYYQVPKENDNKIFNINES